jgi:hypothetical protein
MPEDRMGYFRLLIGGLVAVISFAVAAETTRPTQPVPEDAEAPAVQELKPGSPEWVAREYLTAVRERGFAAEADFMHPDEMARFKSILIPVFAAETDAGGRALINATFGRNARMTEVRLADPAQFLRRFARVMSVRMPDQPTNFDQLLVLGSVKEDEQVHVLVRLGSRATSAAEERLEVVSLLPFEGGWKLMLAPKLEAAVRAMDRRGSDRRPAPRLIPLPPPGEPRAQPFNAENPAASPSGVPARP